MSVDVEDLLRDAGRVAPPTGIDVARAAERGRTLRRRHHVAQAGAAVLALVAGVGLALTQLPSAEPDPTTTHAASDDDPVLRDEVNNDPAGPQAVVRGVLRRDGQCLLLDNGQFSEVVIWPPGTRWSADDEAVTLPEGLRIRLGDTVSGGGGHHAADRESLGRFLDVRTVDRAVKCAQRNKAHIGVFNPYSSIRTE